MPEHVRMHGGFGQRSKSRRYATGESENRNFVIILRFSRFSSRFSISVGNTEVPYVP